MATFSIIVPIYNVEQFLSRCVDSILNQTYRDFELILVDDGSPDRCPYICDEYVKKDRRVQVIHKSNGGLSDARNAGLSIAKGKYILFCDSDDYVSKYWCEDFLKKVEQTEDNYIFCDIKIVNDLINYTDKELVVGTDCDYELGDFIKLQIKSKIGFAWNVCYYGDVIRKNHLRFSTDVIVEDLPFTLEYLKYMKKLTYVGKTNNFYYQDNRETLSRKYYVDGFTRWKEKYVLTNNFINEYLLDTEKKELVFLVATSYLYPFLHSLDNTFDKRNTWSILRKIRFNSKIVNDAIFQDCLNKADTSNEDDRYIELLKNKWYFLAFVLKYIAKKRRDRK